MAYLIWRPAYYRSRGKVHIIRLDGAAKFVVLGQIGCCFGNAKQHKLSMTLEDIEYHFKARKEHANCGTTKSALLAFLRFAWVGATSQRLSLTAARRACHFCLMLSLFECNWSVTQVEHAYLRKHSRCHVECFIASHLRTCNGEMQSPCKLLHFSRLTITFDDAECSPWTRRGGGYSTNFNLERPSFSKE